MDLKLNNSELMAILTHIDDSLGYDIEPLERETYMSIVRKINDNVRTINKAVEKYAVDILNTDYKEGKLKWLWKKK